VRWLGEIGPERLPLGWRHWVPAEIRGLAGRQSLDHEPLTARHRQPLTSAEEPVASVSWRARVRTIARHPDAAVGDAQHARLTRLQRQRATGAQLPRACKRHAGLMRLLK
jgi:hypothetical protein